MKPLFVSLALAGAIVSTSAAAQETAGSTGWYGALKTGLATLNNPTLTISDAGDDEVAGNADDTTLVTRLNTKDAWGFGGELGYDAGAVRFGLELKYQRNKIRSLALRSLNGTAITASNAEDLAGDELDFEDDDGNEIATLDGTNVRATKGSLGRLRQLGIMANVFYDFPLGAVEPYVGVGAGAVGTHLKTFGEDDGNVRFAWQLMAGAAFRLSESVMLTADYSYRQANKGKLKFGDDEETYRLGKTKAQFISAGLRFNF